MKRKFISRQLVLRILILTFFLSAIAITLWPFRSGTALPRTADTGVQKTLFDAVSRGSKPSSLGAVEHPSASEDGRVTEKDVVLLESQSQHRKQDQEVAFNSLPPPEQQSLWKAFAEARHTIQPLTESEAALPQNKGARFFAANPGQRLTARFLDGAVRIESGRGGAWQGVLEFQGGAQEPPVIAGKRVEYHHPDGVIEWYENKAEGVEQGFTLATRPHTSGLGEVRVELALRGLSARILNGENALDFVDEATGATVLRYSKLKVWDSVGMEMQARMEAENGKIVIFVADVGAVYPLTIDPLITSQEAKLAAGDVAPTGDGAVGDNFGCAVALSGDTALIGASGADTAAGEDAGSAYVFVRSGTAWSQQAKLTASDGVEFGSFGSAVALAGDTALIGSGYAGSAYVFVKSGTVWSQQAILTANDSAVDDSFGISVALSGDTALIGASGADTAAGGDAGSAYVFVRSGTAWSQQAKLTASDGALDDSFGDSVALSGDTALIGASGADTAAGANAGSSYVFVRSGNVWSQQAKLTATNGVADDNFGCAVALSGDTALIGAGYAEGAYVFVRSGTAWSQQAKLTAINGAVGEFFSVTVALSGDTALIGASAFTENGEYSGGSAYVFVGGGTVWSQQAKLTALDGASGDKFGLFMALSGDSALIGADSAETAAGEDAGSAYVFVRNGTTWGQQAKLTAGNGAVIGGGVADDNFGCAVALSGDTALIGASGADTAAGANAGSSYVFVRSGTVWSLQAILTAGDGTTDAQFGSAIALSGDTVLITSYAAYTGGYFDNLAGSAYVFVRSGTVWGLQAKLTASDGVDYDYFGSSVALSGDTALIGASGADTTAGANAGSAYVFVRSGNVWSQQAKLTAFNGAVDDYFGSSVALSGDTALIGASGADTAAGEDAGSAYVFVRSGTAWSQQAKLTASDGVEFGSFGSAVALAGDTALIGAYVFVRGGTIWSQQAKLTTVNSDFLDGNVALSGDTALIGAYSDTAAGVNAGGSAYVFVRSGNVWSQQAKLTAFNGAADDYFGSSVALSGDTALIGASYADTAGGVNAGSAYVFRLNSGVGEKTPVVISVAPPSGSIAGGASVRIIGANFTGATAVKFGGTVATSFTVNSSTKITAIAPAHAAGLVDVAVTTLGGTGTGAGLFTYKVFLMAGKYQAIFLHDNSVNSNEPTYSGCLTFSLTKTGSISGKLKYRGLTHSFTGKFTPELNYQRTILRKNQGPLTISMRLAQSGLALSAQLSEFFQSGDIISDATMLLHSFNASKNPAPQAGRYTARIKQGTTSTRGPDAPGYAVVTINKSGVAKIIGKMPDGSVLSCTALLNEDGSSAFYDPLYKAAYPYAGYLAGSMKFDPAAALQAVAGNLEWQKPAQTKGAFWRSGFRQTRELEGSRYIPPISGQRVLSLPSLSGAMTFTASGPANFTNKFLLTTANRFLLLDFPNTKKLAVKVVPSTGLTTGSFYDSALRKTRKLQGVVLQAQGEVSGFFLGDTDSVEWSLSPP